ncbi:hypothetical protein JYU34_020354 [Plutella xylostella]|uniref:Uncharacterized protein n=1 Tax=Plutella xylostella TaxID=51655 RepID=A0ABQ7PUA9_PLUXY|nr:hypothetical protein JYU34_020354 [Plutella xylostella]
MRGIFLGLHHPATTATYPHVSQQRWFSCGYFGTSEESSCPKVSLPGFKGE